MHFLKLTGIRVSFFFLFGLSLLLCVSCASEDAGGVMTSDVSPEVLVNAAIAAYPPHDVPSGVLYLSGATEGSETYLEAEMVGSLLYWEYARDVPEWALLDSYALRVPNGKRVFEVSVLKVKDTADIASAKALLEARLSAKNNGDIQNYTSEEVPYLEAAEIYTIGNYAVLLSTTDNEIARQIIADLLGVNAGTVREVTTAPETETTAETVAETEPETEAETVPAEEPEDLSLEQSEPPTVNLTSHITNTRIFIAGKCVEGAEIVIRYGGEKKVYQTDYTDFMGIADIANSATTEITITAREPGKRESEPVMMSMKPKTGVNILDRMGIYGVIIGDRYQMHIKDYIAGYTGKNLLTNTQQNALRRKTKERVDFLAELNGGELIYILIPSPMTLYPETVPPEYERYEGESLREQFSNIVSEMGATVIDLTDSFLAHKDDEYKIYHKTDTHWTQYGAYLGYLALTNHISQKFPDAAPRDVSLFEFYHKEVYAGDMVEHLELPDSVMQETATFVNLLFDSPDNPDMYGTGRNILRMGTPYHDFHTTKNPQTERTLPTAYILRDSFSSPIYGMMVDTFSETTWQAMWEYSFKQSTIERLKPDYVIYLVSERNLPSMLN